ncbi:hypothetical protein [Enemella sp. A6]|uniref:hypothetical protein n=1 Tax=Enemella sp. A6 TaxID=3440152 RepID=UPI003EBE0D1D
MTSPANGPGHGGPASGAPPRPPWPTTHGAKSKRVYQPLAEQLAAGVLADRPDLAPYPDAVSAWAEAEASCVLLRRFHAEHGLIDDKGHPRPSTKLANVLETRAANLRSRLGLDPIAEVQLAQARAEVTSLGVHTGLAMLAAQGREALAARDAAGIEPPRDLAGELLAAVQDADRGEWGSGALDQQAAHRLEAMQPAPPHDDDSTDPGRSDDDDDTQH